MRLAWSPTLGYAKPDQEVLSLCESAVRVFEKLGCEVVELPEGIGPDPDQLWMAEFYAGVGTRLNGTLSESREILDPAVASLLDKALDQSLLQYYTKVFARYEFRERIRAMFESFDLLLTPTAPVPAFPVNVDVPPQFAGRNPCTWQYYTYPFNLTGQPAASLPVGFTSAGLPVGLQLVSRINAESDIFRAASAFEMENPWGNIRPPCL